MKYILNINKHKAYISAIISKINFIRLSLLENLYNKK